MTNSPKISVIIPTCHRNDLLAKCLDCLAPGVQTLSPDQYEVIVTDDGSRSTAEELVRENYTWAKWVQGPRRGPAANRNYGASVAHGEWLAFTDDDCLPKPEWLQAYADALCTNVHIYEGKTTCEIGLRSPLEDAPINLDGGCLWSCNMIVRKTNFEQVNGFDEAFPHPHMEDTDFRERIKQAGFSLQFVPFAIVDHPPKRIPSGIKLAQFHECEIYYIYKMGNKKKTNLPSVILKTMKWRGKSICRYPFSKDTIIAVCSVFLEVLYLLKHYNTWKSKYRSQLFQSP